MQFGCLVALRTSTTRVPIVYELGISSYEARVVTTAIRPKSRKRPGLLTTARLARFSSGVNRAQGVIGYGLVD